MSAVLLLLLCAGVQLYCSEAQPAYDQLPEQHYKKGVDLVLSQLQNHTAVQLHFLFFKSVKTQDIELGFGVRNIYHNFLLKPTLCAKGTAESDPQRCPFRNDRPMMNCVVCYHTQKDEIESVPKPFVDCIRRPQFTTEIMNSRLERCKKMVYNSGSPTLLAQRQ